MKKNLSSIVKKVDISTIILVIILLSHGVPALRKIVKQLLKWVNHLGITYDFITLDKRYGAIFDRLLLETIAILFVCRLIIISLQSIKTWKTNKTKGNTPFEASLLMYLNHDITDRCYLISGSWGTGKTHMLNNFIYRYYENSSRKVYRLSCFGLSSRSEIISELNNVIAAEDYSIKATISKLLSIIPIIGDFIANILKNTYTYHSVPKNSVFIFDDFERIAMPIDTGVTSPTSYVSTYSHLVEKKLNVNELENITQNLFHLNDRMSKNAEKQVFDKYLSIIGVINDIVESKRSKAIIVCNTDLIGEKFIGDVLRSKLNCREYRNSISNDVRKQLACRVIDSFELADKNKKEVIKAYVSKIDLAQAQCDLKTQNLRVLLSVLEALILTADIFEQDILSQDGFLDSLYSSIFISFKRTGLQKELRKYPIGMNNRLVYPGGKMHHDGRWLGYEVAFYYWNNLARPTNFEDIAYEWKSYKYIDIEKCIVRGDFSAFDIYAFDIFHLCILIDKVYGTSGNSVDWHRYFDKYLDNIDFDDEKSLNLVIKGLDGLNVFGDDLGKYICNSLAIKSKMQRASGNSIWAERYNEYLDNATEKKKIRGVE